MPKSMRRASPEGVSDDVGGLDVLVDDAPAVELREGRGQGDGQLQGVAHLEGLAGELGQGDALDLLQQQHRALLELLAGDGPGDAAHIPEPLEDAELAAVALTLAWARGGGRRRLEDEREPVGVAHRVEQQVHASGLEDSSRRVTWDVQHLGRPGLGAARTAARPPWVSHGWEQTQGGSATRECTPRARPLPRRAGASSGPSLDKGPTWPVWSAARRSPPEGRGGSPPAIRAHMPRAAGNVRASRGTGPAGCGPPPHPSAGRTAPRRCGGSAAHRRGTPAWPSAR